MKNECEWKNEDRNAEGGVQPFDMWFNFINQYICKNHVLNSFDMLSIGRSIRPRLLLSSVQYFKWTSNSVLLVQFFYGEKWLRRKIEDHNAESECTIIFSVVQTQQIEQLYEPFVELLP
jgi:hypothetical protein